MKKVDTINIEGEDGFVYMDVDESDEGIFFDADVAEKVIEAIAEEALAARHER